MPAEITAAISAKNAIIEKLVDEHYDLLQALKKARRQLRHDVLCHRGNCRCAIAVVDKALKDNKERPR